VTEPQNDRRTEPPLLKGWLIFIAIFIGLQFILPLLFFVLGLTGFGGNPGYIELFQQAEGDHKVDLAVEFAFDLLSMALSFGLWLVLGRKFFLRKSGFAGSFLKTLLLSGAIALVIDAMSAFVLGVNPRLGGYSGLIFGLGMAQWLMHSPRVKAVFIR
jgi:hypothetical protein